MLEQEIETSLLSLLDTALTAASAPAVIQSSFYQSASTGDLPASDRNAESYGVLTCEVKPRRPHANSQPLLDCDCVINLTMRRDKLSAQSFAAMAEPLVATINSWQSCFSIFQTALNSMLSEFILEGMHITLSEQSYSYDDGVGTVGFSITLIGFENNADNN